MVKHGILLAFYSAFLTSRSWKELILCSSEFRKSTLLSALINQTFPLLILDSGKVPEKFYEIAHRGVIKVKIVRAV